MEGFLKIFLNRKCHSPIFVKFYNPYLLQINPLLNNFELDLIYKMQLPTSNSNNTRTDQKSSDIPYSDIDFSNLQCFAFSISGFFLGVLTPLYLKL